MKENYLIRFTVTNLSYNSMILKFLHKYDINFICRSLWLKTHIELQYSINCSILSGEQKSILKSFLIRSSHIENIICEEHKDYNLLIYLYNLLFPENR